MKKLLIIALIGVVTGLAFMIPNSGSTASVEFKEGSLAEVLALAKEQNKHVFVDVSTSWCGYCKKMKKNTYTNDKVAEHLNSNYINISINAEVGEGPGIIKTYRVKAYPTELILNGDGKLLSKNVGYLKPNELIAFANR
jgi:thioredoxin-related protein